MAGLLMVIKDRTKMEGPNTMEITGIGIEVEEGEQGIKKKLPALGRKLFLTVGGGFILFKIDPTKHFL
jgi:hypothetical protein